MAAHSAPGGAPGGPQRGATRPEAAGRFSAFVVERRGDDVECGVRELGIDDLPPGEVVVAVDWSAVNYKDGMVSRPGNRVARVSPLVPGVDLVGTVLASAESSLATGTEVVVHGYDLGVSRHGGFSELARVPAAWAMSLPTGMTARQAATIGTAGFTAALSLRRLEHHGLRPGTGPVLVTGATGGVGSMAVSLLARSGYEVVASTGKPDERGYLLGLGAAEVIGRHDLASAPDRTLGAERWSGAVDCVGGPTLAAVLRTLSYGAAVAASGLTGGTAVETTVYPFIVRNVSLLGIDTVLTPMEERRTVWQSLVDAWPPDVVERMVGGEVTLDGLAPVLALVVEGAARGRTLVRPGRSA